MKKALSYILAVILLCGITAACSKDDKDSGSNEVGKTVFVFMPFADNLTTSSNHPLLKDLDEMKSAIIANGNMNGYRVIVYYASASFSSVLYELELQDNKVVNDTIKTFSSVTQNDLQHLTTLFNLVKTTAPAKTYSLLIGGHGCGWVQSDIYWGAIGQNRALTQQHKSFGGSSNERDRIEVATLGTAMTNASFRTDLILFDCCYMGNIETVYDIRNNTDYAITSVSEQPGAGMPYDKIWNDIISTMSKERTKSILQSADAYYDDRDNNGWTENEAGATNLNPLTLAAIDCSEINNIAAAMANLNKQYGECTTDLTDSIQRFDKKNTGIYFDLLDYAKYQAGGNTSDSFYKAVESAVKGAVISTSNKGWYLVVIDSYSPNCFPVNTFCGLATSDPTTNSAVVDKKKLTNWWKDTH